MSTLTQNNAIHRKHRPLKYKVLLNLQFHMSSDWLSPPGCSGRILQGYIQLAICKQGNYARHRTVTIMRVSQC